jgi:hypothetical protein
VPTRDIVLDFDRQHNADPLGHLHDGPRTSGRGGEHAAAAHIGLSVFSNARSGRPYTSPSDIRLINVHRTPAEFNTDLR